MCLVRMNVKAVCLVVINMSRRLETGELLYIPRLEKAVSYLQKRLKDFVAINQHTPCEISFSLQINHYTKMIAATVLNHEEEVDHEYPIIGFSYSIQLVETHHFLTNYETGLDGKEPCHIVNGLLRKMERYDITNLRLCIHCTNELIEKGKECCDICEVYKITYSEICAVCRDEENGPSVWARIECGHVFHRQCLLQIKRFGGNKIKCPLCRQENDKEFEVI
jgi:hypothetical protein